jgi:RHS repeat-associated protein
VLAPLRARYYNTDIGRFTGQDPLQFSVDSLPLLKPQALNFYSYVSNNPLKHTDPTGMCEDDEDCEEENKTVQNLLDAATATIPLVNDLRDVYEVLLKRNLITGQALSEEDAGITALMTMLPLISGAQGRAAADVMEAIEGIIADTQKQMKEMISGLDGSGKVIDEATVSTDQAIDMAIDQLGGKGNYTEIDNGVFRNNQGTVEVRMTPKDIGPRLKPGDKPHINIEYGFLANPTLPHGKFVPTSNSHLFYQ